MQHVSHWGRTQVQKTYVATGALSQSDSKIVALLRPLLPSIVETLESASVPWTWFTGIRIGYRSGSGPALSLDDQYPAVVLINVEYGTTFAQVSAATRTVKNILERNRLDIHVEVRENSIWNHTAISNASQHSTIPNLDEVVKDEYWALYSGVQKRANEELLPLLSTLGWEVSKTATKEYKDYGTSGVFLTFDGVNDLFATTCYHVLLPQKERPTIIKAQSNAPKPKVSQASPKTVSVALKLATDRLEGYRKSSADALEKVKRYDDWRQSSSGSEPEEPTPEERKTVATLKYLNDIVDAVTTVYEDKDSTGQIKPGSGLLKRVIGSIFAAPEYEVCNSQGPIQSPELVGFLNDWCLIKLDGTRSKKASNKLYLGVDRAPAFTKNFLVDSDPKSPIVPKMEELDREKFEKYIASNGGFLPLKGYLEGTLVTPTAKGKSSIPSVRVAKRGATTGLTFGVTNSIEACVREKVVIKGTATKSACSWELLVIPFPDQLSETTSRTRFSEKGDSGSAVLDIYGKFMGQVVSGGPSGPTEDPYIVKEERRWRGEKEGSGNPGKPTLFEKGKMPHEARPDSPELRPFEPGMDVTFVHMAWALLQDIHRFTGKEPKLLGSK
ncbi:hypothetical protein PG984_004137 [Apiospora sp. TS-2023a]